MSKSQLLTVMILGVLVSGNPVHAQMHEEHEHEHKGSMMHEEHMKNDETMMNHEKEDGPIEVGNKICPVSGEKVGEMGDVVQVEHNGKLYNLCCKMCKKDFMKDPEKYSAIAEEEVKNDQKEDMGEEMHEHDEHDHHE